jgi:hypothetical protein
VPRPQPSILHSATDALRDLLNPQSCILNPVSHGAVAQLGERLICIQEVIGSIPFSSTNRPSRPDLEIVRGEGRL